VAASLTPRIVVTSIFFENLIHSLFTPKTSEKSVKSSSGYGLLTYDKNRRVDNFFDREERGKLVRIFKTSNFPMMARTSCRQF